MNRFVFCSIGLLAALLLTSLPCLAAQEDEGESRDGEIRFSVKDGTDLKAIFLATKAEPNKEVKLCETPGWGNLQIHFSPNSNWLIVQDGGGSLGISLRLFQRDKGAQYHEIEEGEIGRKAELEGLRQMGLPAKEVFDHRYATVLTWSANSKYVLVRVSGKGANEAGFFACMDAWCAIYELATGKFSFDLSRMNAAAIEKGRFENK